jgi:hypothetical protein
LRQVDDSIKYRTRDGFIVNVKIEDALVNFSLPFKDTTNIYNDFIVNIYTIGLGTSFYNLLVPLHTNTL